MSQWILITDDDPVVRHILTTILSTAGYQVKNAETGKAGIEVIEEAVLKKDLPALIFLDLLLPGVSGIEVLKTIRKLTGPEHLPVILISANTKVEIPEIPAEIAPEGYLEKPFTKEIVLSMIRELLG